MSAAASRTSPGDTRMTFVMPFTSSGIHWRERADVAA